MTRLASPDELEKRLRAIGAERYHNHHAFHKLLHGGALNRGQIQAWALNRYYYQSRIPIKDAAILARMGERRTNLKTPQGFGAMRETRLDPGCQKPDNQDRRDQPTGSCSAGSQGEPVAPLPPGAPRRHAAHEHRHRQRDDECGGHEAEHHGFGFESWPGFYALFGFVACVSLVLAARELRKLVMRPEDYYEDEHGD